MRSRWCTLILVLIISLAANAAVPDRAPISTTPRLATPIGVIPSFQRDDADEDSLYYEQGFENNWAGWTTRDLWDAGVQWHRTQTHAFSGNSWWSGNEDLNGYGDHWLQYLDSPVMDLRGLQNLRLKFMAYWSVEDPSISPPADSGQTAGYDGWDGCNVWISTNNGDSWQVIRPISPAYDDTSLFSFGYEWGMGHGIPGWTASSGNAQWPAGEWVEASFNLDQYAAQQVKIRWAFCTDPAWHTGEAPDNDNQAWGFLVDSLRVMSGNNTIWSNDGDQDGGMTTSTGPGSGDYWEITEADAHQGRFSAHCPVQYKLQDALTSPPLRIPEVGWYTYFDFWIRCDTQVPDANGDGYLDDFWDLYYSTDGVVFERMIYDWSRDQADWMDRFHYFGPDSIFQSAYNVGRPEWMRKLNLTQFAGETVWLRWVFHTDTVVAGNQGSGIYIDDIHLNITRRRQDDCGVEWLRVNYPTSLGFTTPCKISIRNYGLGTQNQVQRFYRIDGGAAYPIVPWGGLESDEIVESSFSLSSNRLTYADSVLIRAYTVVGADSAHENDTAYAKVLVYPNGIWEAAYDDRNYPIHYNFAVNNGPAVKFTPSTDGIRGAFDVKALKVRWFNEQNVDVVTRLRIFADNRGRIGNQLYSADVTVHPDNCIPAVHTIDLSGVQALQRLNSDFWVYFNISREDHWPQIMGQDEAFGRGHFFVSNGVNADTVNVEFQLHALLMTGGNSPVNTLLVGRDTLNFGAVGAGGNAMMRVALYNGGINPVEVRAVRTEDDHFTLVDFQAKTLGIGDMMHVYVRYDAETADPIGTRMVITSSDGTPPVVFLVANGGVAGVEDESTEPVAYSLGEAYPNPFNATTVIPFTLAAESDVALSIFDLSGRKVADLVNGRVAAGRHSVSFQADGLVTGFYFCRMEARSFTTTQKLILIK